MTDLQKTVKAYQTANKALEKYDLCLQNIEVGCGGELSLGMFEFDEIEKEIKRQRKAKKK